MTTILNGLLGGAVVGILAVFAARLVGGSPSAMGTLIGSVAGERTASRWWAPLAQVLYGSVAGGVLVALELSVLGLLAVPPSRGEAIGVGLGWGLALALVALVVWRLVLDRGLDRSSLGELAAYHLAYGLGLGVWIRLTWIT